MLAPPPVSYALALAIGFGLEALLPSANLTATVRWLVGGALLAAGLALGWAFLAAFRQADTPVDVRKATTALVTTGPYRLSRNPGYVSLALIYAGIVVLANALWAFAPLVPALIVVDGAVIAREERYLERKFGDEYRRFKGKTRRWV